MPDVLRPVELTAQQAADIPVIADTRALRQITLNLIGTSIHLANAGGQVIVSTALSDFGEVVMRVRDTGHGLNDNELAGFKRIVGSFVEASSFGYLTLGYFAFATTLWLNGIVARLTLPLSMLSLLALLLSTSTTAYVGLAAYLTVLFATLAFQFVFRPVRPQMIIFLIGAPFVHLVLSDAGNADEENKPARTALHESHVDIVDRFSQLQ